MVEFYCAVAAKERHEPVRATASQVRAWLLVEVAGAWGRDAVVQSELGPFAPAVWRQAMKRQGIRVLTIRRDLDHRHDHEESGLRLVHVTAPRPGGVGALAHRRIIYDLHEVVSATESIIAGHGPGPEWGVDGDRYALVCTNGRHDACCATFGRPVIRELRASAWAQDAWECSHVGGDRFAANIVLLPDSLYFGDLDVEGAKRVMEAHDEGRLDLESFRGRSTFRLLEQAAEHAVRLDRHLDAVDAVVAASVLDDGRVRIQLADGADLVVAVEQVMRPSPTPLTCKGADSVSYPEFRILGIEDLAPQRKPDTTRGV